MKAKKLLVLMLSLLVLIGVIVGMSSCGGDNKVPDNNGGCKHVWSQATCTEPQTCYFCGAKTGEALGHIGGTCGTASECKRCKQVYGAGTEHKWAQATCTEPKHCTVCGLVDGKELGHVGGSANCESPAICDRCHAEYGEKSNHSWTDATCTEPKHCTVCGTTDGKELGHKGGNATCETLATCDRCHQSYGSLADHAWNDATCTDPKNCTVCGATGGAALGHKGGTADCTNKAVCEICSQPYGELGAHNWVDASCTEAKHCDICGKTEGEALGHKGGTPTCQGPAECEVCDMPYGEPGTHKGGTATCTKGAVCSTCMQEYTAPLSHSWTDATCTEAKSCENCGLTEGAPIGHTGGHSTCTSLAVCNVCGQSYGTTSAHDYSAKNTDASYIAQRGDCVTTATYYYSCSVCGDRDVNNTFEGQAAVGHAFGEYETINGVHTRTCSVCHTPEIGNCLFDAESGKGSAATCLKPAVCSVCEREYGAALGHDWNNGEITTLPGCTESGVKTYTCNNCNGTKTESVAPTGHSFGDYTVTTPATCLTNGVKTASCACGETKTEDIPAKGHTPGAAATCTTNQVCTTCSEELAPATGHNRVLVNFTPATCTAERVNYYECACGDKSNEKVGDKLGHDTTGVTPKVEIVSGKTCEYTHKYACKHCGEIVKTETVISHVKWTAAITTPATCTSEGIKTLTCDGCGATEEQAIEIDTSLGHAWDGGVTADSIITYTCIHCGETKTVKVITSGDKVSGSDLDNELQVGDDTNFELDAGVKDLIGDQEISVSSDKLTEDQKNDLGLDEIQLGQIGNNPIYNFTIEGENGFISDFQNNYITITLPYELSEGEDVDSIAIWFINDKGEVEAIKATYNAGYVTFQTNHFSSYTVTRLTPQQRCALYGHSSSFTYVYPTCTENGYILEFCVRCGYSGKDTPTEYEAYGHSYSEETVPATCTVAGSTTYTCGTCNHTYTVVINPLNHNYVLDREVAATCMNPGAKYFVCEREGCNASYTETIAQLDHDMVQTVTAPTCGNGGYTTHYCKNEGCTYSYVDSYTAPLDHDYEIWLEWDGDKVPNGNPNNGKYGHCTVKLICKNCTHEYTLSDDELHMSDEITLPTCNDKGNKKYIVRFTVNGKVHEYKIKDETFFDMFRHEFGEGYNKYNDTHHWSECKCGAKENEAKHSFGKGVVTKVATCTSEGEITYSCECGYTKTETVDKLSHTFSSGWTTDDNNHWKVCSVCETVEAKAEHSFGKGKVSVAPTCATEGEMTYRCDCGYVKTEVMPTTDDHNYGKKDIKFDEYTHWYECRNCHGKVNEAAHSDSEAIIIRPATCTETGESKVECDCGFADVQILLPLGHSYTNYVSNGDATCGNDGTKTAKCDNGCGATDTVTDEGTALTHSYTNYVSNGDATCGIDGTKTALCDNGCGTSDTLTDKGSALTHSFTNYVSDSNATCEMDGTKTAKCDHGCGKVDTLLDRGSALGHSYTNYVSNGDATCEKDGTKTAKCDNGCGKINTVTDEGSKLAHVFTNYVSNGDASCGKDGTKTAKCDNGCGTTDTVTDEGTALDHFAYETKINKPATCTDDGEKLIICICGHSWTEVIPSEGGSHSYDETVYENDDNNHWNICTACNQKVAFEAHYVAETIITNGNSCDDPSTKTEICICGYVLATEVLPGGNHNLTETVTVDLGAYGVCGGGTFTYTSCMCGATKSFTMEEAENTFTECDMDEISEDYGVDENGNQWMSMEMECSKCGVHVSANATATKEGCLIRAEYVYTFSINDEIIVDNLQFVMEQMQHNTVRDKLMLDEYCGGYIDVNRCQNCGLITYVGDLNPECNVEEPEMTEKEVDGITYYVMSVTCPDCGLYFEMTQWQIDVSVCEYKEYMRVVVKHGDTVIAEHEDYSYYNNHQYDETYELIGKTCEDGVKIKSVCTVCGHEYNSMTHGHYKTEDFMFDLQEYGGCGGYIEGRYCNICNTISSVYNFNVKCHVDIYSGDIVEIDGITYTIIDTYCPECGLHYYVREWNEYTFESKCNYYTYREITVSNDEGVIVSGTTMMYNMGHKYVYNYIFTGSCDDGYTVQVTCENCDYYTEHYGRGHDIRTEEYYLGEYGVECGGFVQISKCVNCGTVTEFWSNLGCKTYYVGIDENDYDVYECRSCGLLFREKSVQSEKDEYCNVTNNKHVVMTFADSIIFDVEVVQRTTAHNMIVEYKLLGETCDDGYEVNMSCSDCGMSYGGYVQYGHNITEAYIDLKEYGACGGSISYSKCAICDEIVNVDDFDINCEDGYGYYDEEIDGVNYSIEYLFCPECGLYIQIKEWTERDGEYCASVEYMDISVSINNQVIFSASLEEYREGHDLVKEYQFMGETCDDGYYVIVTCKNCDYYDQYEQWGHHLEYYEFNSPCGSRFYGDKCNICGLWYNAYGDLSMCDVSDPSTSSYEENGIIYNVMQVTCSKCDHNYTILEWEEYLGGCTYKHGNRAIIALYGEVLVDYTEYSIREEHNFEKTTEFLGDSCADGYIVYTTCSECGYSTSYEGYDHSWMHESIDLYSYGMSCGGYGELLRCTVCDEVRVSYINSWCGWSYNGTDDQGNRIETCYNCGATRTVAISRSEKDENCQVVITYTYNYIVDGNVVLSYSSYSYNAEHNYEETVTMFGESCEDGYTVVGICTECGTGYENTSYDHNYQPKVTVNFGDYGCCSHHVFVYYECYCGQYTSRDWDSYNYYYNNNTKSYTCNFGCGAMVKVSTIDEIDGCNYTTETRQTLFINDEEITYFSTSESYVKHDIKFTATVTDGNVSICGACSKCDHKIGTDDENAEMAELEYNENEGTYCYDLVFTPEESGYYLIYSIASWDTYVHLYRVYDGYYEQIDSNDDGGKNNNFRLNYYLEAGETYVYRIRNYDRQNSQSIPYVFIPSDMESVNECNHVYTTQYILAEGSKSCTDGIVHINACERCGDINNYNYTTGHENFLVERISLASTGICGQYGYVEVYACLCGERSYLSFSYNCNAQDEWQSYHDDNGVYHELYTTTCADCGLLITRDYYTVTDGCKNSNVYKYNVSVGDEHVITDLITVEHTWYNHTYAVNGFEFDTEDMNCESGVTVHFECKYCDAYYSNHYTSHNTSVLERIELSDIGACGGYVEVHGCPCGYNKSVHTSINCMWDGYSSTYVDDNGVTHNVWTNTCSTCGFSMIEDGYNVKEGCYRINYYTYTFSMGEEVVLYADKIVSSRQTDHTYQYEYVFDTESHNCEDGVTIYVTCRDCDYTQEYHRNYHDTNISNTYYYVANYGACGTSNSNYFRVRICPCGYSGSYNEYLYNCGMSSSYDYYTDDNSVYHEIYTKVCRTCGLTIIRDTYTVSDGCDRIQYREYSAFIGETVILDGFRYVYSRWQEHHYGTPTYDFMTEVEDCEEGVTIHYVCDDCGYSYDDTCYYHSNILKEKHSLKDYGACGENGYVEYYECPCGETASVSYSTDCMLGGKDTYYRDENGLSHRAYTSNCIECGLIYEFDTYIVSEGCQRVTYTSYRFAIGETEIFACDFIRTNSSTAHNYQYTYEFDSESMNCEDGVTIYVTCRDCDYTNNYHRTYHDSSATYTIYYLGNHGACGPDSYIRLYSCPCGYSNSFSDGIYNCSMSGSYSYPTDENGVSHEIYTRTCYECGLTIVRDRYYEQVGCQLNYIHTYTVSIGDEIIVDGFDYIYSRESSHTYGIPTYTFDKGVEDCENGVTLHYSCKICDYSYDEYRGYHSTILKEKIDLSDLGACDGYIEYYECPCGKESSIGYGTNCSISSESRYVVDENGRTHWIIDYLCSECGLAYSFDEYTVKEGCYRNKYDSYVFKMGESIIFEAQNVRSSQTTNHDYQLEFEFNGDRQNCEDGVTVYVTCKDCSYTDSYYRDYHERDLTYVNERYYLADYGVCGIDNYINTYSCPCEYSKYYTERIYNCSMTTEWNNYTDENGVSHETYTRVCAECGLTIVRDYCVIIDGCDRTSYYSFTVSVGDTVIIDGFTYVESRWQQHNYSVPTYTFDSVENCESGVTVHYTCLDCGYTTDEYRTHHSTNLIAKYNLADYGACGGYVEYYSCPCGYSESVGYSLNCGNTHSNTTCYVGDDGVTHAKYSSICRNCAIIYEYDNYYAYENCQRIGYQSYRFAVGETEIFTTDYIATNRSTYHDYQYEFVFDNGGSSCYDGVTVYTTCKDCDYSSENHYTSHTRVVDKYYYLSEYGTCYTDSYVRVRSCACGYSTNYTENVYNCSMNGNYEYYTDGQGRNHTVYTRVCSNCDLSIVYDNYTDVDGCNRITYYDYTIKSGDEVIVDSFHHVYNRNTVHTYGIPTYSFTTENENCESGVTYHYECTLCDYSYDNTYYSHQTVRKEYYDLTEYGACSGYVEYLECACGEVSNVGHSLHGSYTTNNYYDEDGVFHQVYAYACSTCGLRYQDDYTSVRDNTTCKRINDHNVIISVGAQFVANLTYVTTNVEHDYVVTGQLKPGATTCDEGVTVTNTCRDCGYSYSNNYYSHQRFEVERYDIQSAQYGSALCPGYFYKSSCACGQYTDMNYNTLCHNGQYYISCWIDNNVTGWIHTAEYPDYSIHLSNNAYRLTCSVTDPEQCGYTARCTTYWLFAEDECKVYQYQTWQLGYNEETGTCAYEITFKTGNSYIAHNYEETSLNETWDNGNTKVSGTRYDCPDCGSYYYEKNTYAEDGSHLTYERLFENKLNDGKRKLYYNYREYENGDTVLEYTRYVDANDFESWYKYEYTRNHSYVGPFGESGYEYEEKYSNHNTPAGEYEHIRQYAYVYYKGYDYYIYDYHFYSAYWEKYDYTYNLNGTCERTTHYTTSYGVDETNTELYHRYYNDVYEIYPTCTQDGYYDRVCGICESVVEDNILHNPYDHNWRLVTTNFYMCTRCGIDNINGASGDIVMEDLTNKYGNGENYVAGYWARNNVQFVYYVSIWLHEYDELEDPQIVLFDIEVFELDDVRALAFSKSAVIAAADALGYAEGTYDVAISFVPVGADGSYDYSVIFSDSEMFSIDGSLVMDLAIPLFHYEDFKVEPTVSGYWTFYTSDYSFDVYGELYDYLGNLIASDDDGAGGRDFKIYHYLEAGKTYTLRVRPLSYYSEGLGTVILHVTAPTVE